MIFYIFFDFSQLFFYFKRFHLHGITSIIFIFNSFSFCNHLLSVSDKNQRTCAGVFPKFCALMRTLNLTRKTLCLPIFYSKQHFPAELQHSIAHQNNSVLAGSEMLPTQRINTVLRKKGIRVASLFNNSLHQNDTNLSLEQSRQLLDVNDNLMRNDWEEEKTYGLLTHGQLEKKIK